MTYPGFAPISSCATFKAPSTAFSAPSPYASSPWLSSED